LNATVEAALDESAKELAKDIDAQVLCQAMEDSGWHKVDFDFYKPSITKFIEVIGWIDNNCRENFRCSGSIVFKHGEDATHFTLRWI
jgi:hypothetical protein